MGVWDSSDDALLAGVAAGDRTAAVVFVRRFQRRVYGLALTIVRDQGRAEDVAQDAFVRAWRNAASFDPRRGSVTTWLLAITRNVAIDCLRREAVRPSDPIDPTLLAITDPAKGPDDVALLQADVARVAAAVGALPESQRRCVVLATIGGCTAVEISESEQIPLGTAKTRIRDGLIRLRVMLAEGEPSRD